MLHEELRVVHLHEAVGPERAVDEVTVGDEQVDVDERPRAIRIEACDLGPFQEHQRAVDDLPNAAQQGDRRHDRRACEPFLADEALGDRLAALPKAPGLERA